MTFGLLKMRFHVVKCTGKLLSIEIMKIFTLKGFAEEEDEEDDGESDVQPDVGHHVVATVTEMSDVSVWSRNNFRLKLFLLPCLKLFNRQFC